MEISKKLLHAIALSVAVGGVTACTALEETITPEPEPVSSEEVNQPHGGDGGEENPEFCPACGMG